MSKIPDGFHSVTPYLAFRDAAAAIDFYKQALGAEERYRLPGPDGKGVGHAEIRVGDCILMLSDEFPGYGATSAETLGGSPVRFAVYVADVDLAFERAVRAGCTVVRPVETMFYGDRAGCVRDTFGYTWTLMTHLEDVAPEELKRRLETGYSSDS